MNPSLCFWIRAVKLYGRCLLVSRTVTNVMKGIGAGMAAGIAVGVVGSAVMQGNRKFKKTGRRALHAMEELLGNVSYMMK